MEPENTNFAVMTIADAPNEAIFDFPSFMSYLGSFEDKPISLESAANRVFDDLFIRLRPIWALVHVRTARERGAAVVAASQRQERDPSRVAQPRPCQARRAAAMARQLQSMARKTRSPVDMSAGLRCVATSRLLVCRLQTVLARLAYPASPACYR